MKLHPKLFTPTYDKVVLQVFRVDKTEGGLSLPESMGELSVDRPESPTALVVAVGPDCKQIKRGDRVLMAAGTGAIKTTYRGYKAVCVCHEEEVLAVIDEPDEVKAARFAESDTLIPMSSIGILGPRGELVN